MTDETTVTSDVTAEDTTTSNVNISIEQICAAIINTLTSIEVPLENLLASYGGKVIAIDQDKTTKAVTFTLADAPIEDSSNSLENTEIAE